MTKPRIAMVIGDPAGIGPEITAKVLADVSVRQQADILLIADRAEAEKGMRFAGVEFPYRVVASPDAFAEASGDVSPQQTQSQRLPGTPPVLYDYRGNTSGPFPFAEASEIGGRYCLETLKVAVSLALVGKVDGIVYAPLNKTSLHSAGMTEGGGELPWFAGQLGYTGPYCEFNVLGDLWTSRVTSHVAIQKVSSLITEEAIIGIADLTHRALRQSGLAEPRIAVCGLNPHNGDNGNFGREELDVIAPACEAATAKGNAGGWAVPGGYDLFESTGREQRVRRDRHHVSRPGTDCHEAHGLLAGRHRAGRTAGAGDDHRARLGFDIAGKGKANPGSLRNAFGLACRMAETKRQAAVR